MSISSFEQNVSALVQRIFVGDRAKHGATSRQQKDPGYPLDEDAAFNDDSNTVVAVCRKTMPSSATQPVYINPQK